MRSLVGCLLLGCCAMAWGQTAPVPPASTTGLEELVRQLGADNFRLRQEAAHGLLLKGQAALPLLNRALKSPEIEVRKQAETLIEKISRQVDSQLQMSTKTIRLDYRNLPLNRVISDFQAKTGIPLVLEPARGLDTSRLVTVVADELPPWEALDALLRQTGLKEVFREEMPRTESDAEKRNRSIYYGPVPIQYTPPGKTSIWLTSGTTPKLSADRGTALRVMVLPPEFSGHRLIRGSGQLQLCLDVTPLPHLGWDETLSVQLTRAEDETGRPVSVSHRPISTGISEITDGNEWNRFGQNVVFFNNGAVYYGGMGGQPNTPNSRVANIALRTDDRSMKQLKVFEGTVTGQILLSNQVLGEIEDLRKAANRTLNPQPDTTFSILSYSESPQGKVTLRTRQQSPNQWRALRGLGGLGNNFGGRVLPRSEPLQLKYYDATGKVVPQPFNTSSSSMDDGITMTSESTWVFDKRTTNGPPVKLVIIGTKPKVVEIPFRLTDVILP